MNSIDYLLKPVKAKDSANKQFAVNRESVVKITVWYDSRLFVTLNTDTPERIFVSKNRAAEFKQWMTEE